MGWLALAFTLHPTLALAYIDPGTGSYLFQALTAALIGGIFVVRSAWEQIRARVARLFGRKRGD